MEWRFQNSIHGKTYMYSFKFSSFETLSSMPAGKV